MIDPMPIFRRRKHETFSSPEDQTSWEVWNRAATERGGSNPGPGDDALAALLRLHNEAMSSGLLHAVTDGLTRGEFDRALAGYRYFGLDAAAEVAEAVLTNAFHATEDELDNLEADAHSRYGAIVPDDATLVSSFQRKFAASPDAFAPVV
jgi:hypothetical protein